MANLAPVVSGASDQSVRPANQPSELHVHLVWPPMASGGWREDFFFGAWHAQRPVRLTYANAPEGVDPALAAGERWGAISNTSEGASLVHPACADIAHGTLFRGYLLDPPIHSWSPSGAISRYWAESLGRRHNGVFAAVRFGNALEIITDAYGISPIYWRRLPNGLVLVASSPRFLRLQGDVLDDVSERLFMHRGALIGDRSLLSQVYRAEPGAVLRFDGEGPPSIRSWYDWDALPPGTEPITDDAVELAETAFLTAVDRCTAVMPGATEHVPLSSGDDSRRIIAALHARGRDPQALTVRVLQKEFRDLDARFAAELASRFGFAHRVIEMVGPDQYVVDDHDVRTLFAGEVSEHAWLAPLIRALPNGRSLVFDGLAGDIFGNTGFGVPGVHVDPPDIALQQVAELATPDKSSDVLRPGAWCSLTSVRDYIVRQVGFLPPTTHRADLAFLLIRARRGTGPAMQHLLPAGHVAVYPYLDLDHAEATLRFRSLDKLAQTLQARCLQRYWPEYYAVGGSRRIPPGIPAGSDAQWRALQLARLRQLGEETPLAHTMRSLVARLRPKYAIPAAASRAAGTYNHRMLWWLAPFFNLEAVRATAPACTVCGTHAD